MNKRLLVTVSVIVFGLLSAKPVYSQCSVSDIVIQVNSYNANTCSMNLTVSYEQEVNVGNKIANIHLWQAAAYHTPSSEWPSTPAAQVMYSAASKYPKAAALVNCLATIVINGNGSASPTIGTTYLADPSVMVLSSGLAVTKTPVSSTRERIIISNITLNIPNCSGNPSYQIKGDVWSSQTETGKNVHCATQGLAFAVNDPQVVSAFKVCNPRSLTFSIRNNGSTAVDLFYRIYRDDEDGIFEPGADDQTGILTSNTQTVAAGGTRSENQLAFPGSDAAGENSSYWLQVVVPSTGYSTVAYIDRNATGCVPLPVTFADFEAIRKADAVTLHWTTFSESMNKGFYLERNSGRGWEQIHFEASQAADGNSDSKLTYEYEDRSAVGTLVMYRIRQEDLDGKSSYSPVRSVKGFARSQKMVLAPNPAPSGNTTITLPATESSWNVYITDMNGRQIRQWTNITTGRISASGLGRAVYLILAVESGTGQRVHEKLVVN